MSEAKLTGRCSRATSGAWPERPDPQGQERKR